MIFMVIPLPCFSVLLDDQRAALPKTGMRSLQGILLIIHHGTQRTSCSPRHRFKSVGPKLIFVLLAVSKLRTLQLCFAARLFNPNPRSSTVGTPKLWTLTHSIDYRFFRDISSENARILTIPFQDFRTLRTRSYRRSLPSRNAPSTSTKCDGISKIHRCW